MSEAENLFGEEHIRRYRETDGEVGHIWRRGSKILLLTTKGRNTGEQTTTPLIYEEDGDRYVIVASKGGAPEHPGWYRNLAKEPQVELQVKDEVFPALARTAAGDERERLLEAGGATVAGLRRVPDADRPGDPGRRARARLASLSAGGALVRMRVRPRREQGEQRNRDEVAERRLGPMHLGGAVEPGRLDEEDDGRDEDLAEPRDDEEQRREHDAPEPELRETHCGREVEHVPGEPEHDRSEQRRCDERRECDGKPTRDEHADSEDLQRDADDRTHQSSPSQ